MMARPREDVLARFWSKVRKTEGCWIWTAFCSPYGRFRPGGRGLEVGAHRFSYELHSGGIPEGMWVLHKCDNPRCVRPDHLYLGTALENNRDAARRGRSHGYRTRGEANPVARLTEDQVRSIKARIGAGETVASIADEMMVPRTTLYSIKQGRNWAHV